MEQQREGGKLAWRPVREPSHHHPVREERRREEASGERKGWKEEDMEEDEEERMRDDTVGAYRSKVIGSESLLVLHGHISSMADLEERVCEKTLNFMYMYHMILWHSKYILS